MIDREGRDKAAQQVRCFAVGRGLDADFGELEPLSSDPVVHAIWESLWRLHSELVVLTGRDVWVLPLGLKRKIANWLMFLYSDEEYRWPPIAEAGLRPFDYGWLPTLLGLQRKQDKFLAAGLYRVWPFFNYLSFEQNKQRLSLLLKSPTRLLS